MAVQIRNTHFEADVAARRNELAAILAAGTPISAVKKVPIPRSNSPKYTYEVVMIGVVVYLEVAGDTAPADIVLLDAVITGVIPLILQTSGWEVGTDQDLRAG
ncbi:MAG: hypothetical protein Q8P59_01000 [Dehalococcoidia bacterium]|nr:hypothetical protein [Dehalococcoidia bacterium]